jgi:hypothetical protein
MFNVMLPRPFDHTRMNESPFAFDSIDSDCAPLVKEREQKARIDYLAMTPQPTEFQAGEHSLPVEPE